jgi:hypothetical protein
MRKAIAIVTATLILCLSIASVVAAQDKMVSLKVNKVTVAKDKTGNEYVGLSVENPKELNGVAYTTSTSAMVFGDGVAKAKTVKQGQTVKMIVSEREFKGNSSYTVLKIVE